MVSSLTLVPFYFLRETESGTYSPEPIEEESELRKDTLLQVKKIEDALDLAEDCSKYLSAWASLSRASYLVTLIQGEVAYKMQENKVSVYIRIKQLFFEKIINQYLKIADKFKKKPIIDQAEALVYFNQRVQGLSLKNFIFNAALEEERSEFKRFFQDDSFYRVFYLSNTLGSIAQAYALQGYIADALNISKKIPQKNIKIQTNLLIFNQMTKNYLKFCQKA